MILIIKTLQITVHMKSNTIQESKTYNCKVLNNQFHLDTIVILKLTIIAIIYLQVSKILYFTLVMILQLSSKCNRTTSTSSTAIKVMMIIHLIATQRFRKELGINYMHTSDDKITTLFPLVGFLIVQLRLHLIS